MLETAMWFSDQCLQTVEEDLLSRGLDVLDDNLVLFADDGIGCLKGDIVAVKNTVLVFEDYGIRIAYFEAWDDSRVGGDGNRCSIG